MFATTGTIEQITKVEGKKTFYSVVVEKKRKTSKYKLLFYIFKDNLIEDIKSNKIDKGSYVDITFYIKGSETSGILRNHLYATEVCLIKPKK
jgi:hypothetical protein